MTIPVGVDNTVQPMLYEE